MGEKNGKREAAARGFLGRDRSSYPHPLAEDVKWDDCRRHSGVLLKREVFNIFFFSFFFLVFEVFFIICSLCKLGLWGCGATG